MSLSRKLWLVGITSCFVVLACTVSVQADAMQKKIKARQAIEQTYLDVLGRKATSKDIEYYTNLLQEGKSAAAIRKGIVLSEECKNAINKIFKKVTGHEANEKNLNKARQALAEGKTLAHVRKKLQKK